MIRRVVKIDHQSKNNDTYSSSLNAKLCRWNWEYAELPKEKDDHSKRNIQDNKEFTTQI